MKSFLIVLSRATFGTSVVKLTTVSALLQPESDLKLLQYAAVCMKGIVLIRSE